MPLSPAFLQAIFAQETDEVLICLVTIVHESNPNAIYRFSSDPTTRIDNDLPRYATFSRGNWYEFVPFDAIPPESGDDAPRGARLVISNVGRELVPLLRSVVGAPRCTLELVLASDPETVQMMQTGLEMLSYSLTEESIAIPLGYRSLVLEPYPAGSFTPNAFPGLFR
jgi:hypothetical protein